MADLDGRRVAVTGAGGFIGSQLVRALVERGADVRGFLRYDSRGGRGALDWLEPDIAQSVTVTAGDVRDQESVADAIKDCEVVFHLAALVAVPYSYVSPRSYFETNVLGTVNVAQACLEAGVARLVHTSTSEVYGTGKEIPMTERHPLVGQSPYAASKIGADKVVESYNRSFQLPAVTLRPFNTYGPGQSARAIVPTILSQALSGDTIELGSLEPRRDFTYVHDTVRGFLAVGFSEGVLGETFVLGTGRDVSIRELVDEIGRMVNRSLHVEQRAERARPPESEVQRLVAGADRLTQVTGWSPEVPLEEGLALTADWLRAHPELYRVDEYAI
jgi:NAD dependent epimerase/dehydratase